MRYGIAEFYAARELQVIDLTALPEVPSVFDDRYRRERDRLLFLSRFVDEISAPIIKDGREHVDYVPSQVISEYFALVFQTDAKEKLDGLVYPSAIHPGGKNIVVFPERQHFDRNFDQVSFQVAWESEFATWPELLQAIGKAVP